MKSLVFFAVCLLALSGCFGKSDSDPTFQPGYLASGDNATPDVKADPETVALRDPNGNLTAKTFNGNLNGNATTATTATTAANFSGNLAGDVTGTQSTTKVVALQGKTLSNNAPGVGQVLQYDGSEWSPTTLVGGGGGTVTAVTAGNGLSGGTINTSGTIALKAASTTGLGGIQDPSNKLGLDLAGNVGAVSADSSTNVTGTVTSSAVLQTGATMQGSNNTVRTVQNVVDAIAGASSNVSGKQAIVQSDTQGNITVNGLTAGAAKASSLNASGAVTAGSFSGDGSALTNLTATSVGSGIFDSSHLAGGNPTAGQVLTYAGPGQAQWTTVSGGGGSGNFTGLMGDVTTSGAGPTFSATVVKLQGTQVSNAPPTTTGEVLRYNKSTLQWEASTDGSQLTNINGAQVSNVASATNASQLGGLTGSSNIAASTASVVQTDSSGNFKTNGSITGASFSGNGASLTNINGAQVSNVATATNATNAANLTGTNLAGDVTNNGDIVTVAKLQGTAVSSTAPNTTGQVLRYNGGTSKWEASTDGSALTNLTGANVAGNIVGNAGGFTGSLGGDVTGTQGSTTVAKIQGTSVSTTAPTTTGQVLRYNGGTSKWEAAALVAGDIAAGGTFAAINGSALTNLTGANVVGNITGNAAGFSGSLTGDVTGTQASTVVSSVGSSATVQRTAKFLESDNKTTTTESVLVDAILGAGSDLTAGGPKLLQADASGNFKAGTITATLSGNATSATNVTGIVAIANGGTNATTANGALTSLAGGNAPNAANGLVKLDGSSKLPAVDGSQLFNVMINAACCRLSLDQNFPVTTADQLARTTVYLLPYKGNNMPLYDGVSQWRSYLIAAAGLSVPVPATTSTNFDIFLYDNGGTLTLETDNWNSDNSRGTFDVVYQDGVLVKSGATNKRYLGTARTTGVSGQTEDSNHNRLLYNAQNRRPRVMSTFDSSASWTIQVADGTFFAQDGGNINWKHNLVIGGKGGSEEPITSQSSVVANYPYVSAIAFDSTTPNRTTTTFASNGASASGYLMLSVSFQTFPGIGYHTVQGVETTWGNVQATGIGNNSGLVGGGSYGANSGMFSQVWQ